MKAVEIHDMARRLFDAHGDKAEAEAAQKAASLESEGKADEAADWQKVREAIRQIRPPHES